MLHYKKAFEMIESGVWTRIDFESWLDEYSEYNFSAGYKEGLLEGKDIGHYQGYKEGFNMGTSK
jgi:hypothetical protein